MKLEAVLDGLRELAPETLAEPWDRVGLQVGDPSWPVRRAMLCIDLTRPVLDEAIAAKAGLIVAYHPPIFSPLEALTSQDPKQAIILHAARHAVAVYSPHTALDAAPGGVNDWLCDGLGSGARRAIRHATDGSEASGATYKLVTFVPHEKADALRTALSRAGAGVIEGYTQCSFGLSGQGTFRGGVTTNPTVGKRGRLERVAELRLEMVCPGDRLGPVVGALRQAHPYEEPAFDLYRLEPPPQTPEARTPPSDGQAVAGQGRVVTLDKQVSPAVLIKRVKDRLGVRVLDVAVPDGLKTISQIGVCAGAGGSLLKEARPIDAFITGEMRHHDVLAARAAGIIVLLAGHTQTERPYLRTYRRRIKATGTGTIQWLISKTDRPPSRLR
jgi:dinuclear metal center YbgI/SA1388 family protein